jgi:hypothetical protein
MIPTTPNGTRSWRSSSPLASVAPRTTSPTGSGSAATSRSPPAMPSIRASSSRRRSTTGSGVPFDRAPSTSSALALRMLDRSDTNPAAIASSAASFVDRGATASS